MASEMWNAAFDGDAERVRAGIEECQRSGTSPDEYAYENVTPLYLACEFNHHEVLNLLVQAGCDVNRVSKHGVNPIYIAAEKGHRECLRLLVSSGRCDLDAVNDKGFTSLYRLSERGPLDCLEVMLQSPCDKNKPNSGGFTPLMVAAERNGLDAVKLLLKYGADKDKPSRGGNTAPHFARMGNNQEVADYIENFVPVIGEVGESVSEPPAYEDEIVEEKNTVMMRIDIDTNDYKDKAPNMWNEMDVAAWLQSLGPAFSDYKETFVENGVNGTSLLEDFDEDVMVELGITKKLHRKRLIREIVVLKE